MWIFKLLFWIVIAICVAYLAFLIYAGWTISAGTGIIFSIFSLSIAAFILFLVVILSKGSNDRRD